MPAPRAIVTVALVATAATAATAACGTSGDGSPGEPGPTSESESRGGGDHSVEGPKARVVERSLPGASTEPDVELPRRVDFQLLDAGAEPRAPRRYALAAGEPASFTVTLHTSTRELDRGTWSEAVALPQIRYGLGIHNVTTAGGVAVQVRGLSPEIAAGDGDTGAEAHALAEQTVAGFRRDVERKRASVIPSRRGFFDAIELAVPPATDAGTRTTDELYQLLLQSVVPFPDGAIGVGARWRATTMLRRGAGVVEQTATYELLEVAGERLRVGVHLKQIGEHQTVSAPGLPANTVSELVALLFEAEGTITIAPGVLTPVRGTLSVELRVHSRLVAPRGQTDAFHESTGEIALATE